MVSTDKKRKIEMVLDDLGYKIRCQIGKEKDKNGER
jgi:hypothetical protein